MDFGTFLKQKRQEHNMTQKQLAELLYVTPSAVSKWEKNVAHPDITLLLKLSELLNVTEHELISASIDKARREEQILAKRWKVLSSFWSIFFCISYGIALIVCFICNLCIDKTLSWFFIVLSSIILSFTCTNLPKLIKGYKLIFIPLSIYSAVCLLLGVCCIYTGGSWFFIATLSVFFALIVVFLPICIYVYDCFDKIKKYNAFISVATDFLLLSILLLVINAYTVKSYSTEFWYPTIALPIVVANYLVLNMFLSVRFLKVNKLLKTSIIMYLINFLYLGVSLLKVNDINIQKEIDQTNIFRADFSLWQADVTLENNVHLIIFLTVLLLGTVFLLFGLLKNFKKS